MNNRKGFTLVELLVVITIISLLIGILLPALAKARKSAQLAVSLSNVHQISLAMFSYRQDNKERLNYPIYVNAGGVPFITPWTYGGKYSSLRWAANYDVPPGLRPLNAYVYPDRELDKTIVHANRDKVTLDAFRSPGDSSTTLGNDGNTGSLNASVSTYDDVGVSYFQNQWVWRTQIRGQNTPANNDEAWRYANRQLNTVAVDPMRMVMFSDKLAPTVIADLGARLWQSEFEGVNKSVMGFLDGHSDYLTVERRPATALNPLNHVGYGSLVSGGTNANDAPFKYSFILPARGSN